MNEMRKLMEAIDVIEEAYQGGKTEHSGAKKGKGAFYGRKKEAKRDSNKNRRRAGKDAALGEGEYSDYEPGEDAIYDYGVIRAKLMFADREVTLTHGRGESIFLHMDEWEEFVGELKDTF